MADFCEGGSRFEYRCYTPDVPGVWRPQVHRSCTHNMVSALLQRTLGSCPGHTPRGLAAFQRAGRELRSVLKGRSLGVVPWSFGRVVASYRTKRMRERYARAETSLATDGLATARDAKVKAFVKGEKLANFKVAKPRVIMARDPRYNLELASYLKPVEHDVYGAFRGWGSRFLTHTRLIGKGLSLEQRATLLRKKLLSHPDVVAFEVDCKSFESHVTVEQLSVEHSVYLALCPDPRLRKLLSYQLEFEGFGAGVRYHAKGIRASGDFNTGLGNTLIMCCLVLASAKRLGIRFDFLADGDNAVLFVRRTDLDAARRGFVECFLEMGHELALEEPAEQVEDVVFGQSKPIWAAGRWTMVRDPFKVLSQACCGHQHYAEMRGGIKVLRSVAYCEAVLSRGVPVLQAFAQSLLRATRGVDVPLHLASDNFEYERVLARGVSWEATKQADISSETRIQFERSWGVSVGAQLMLEERLSGPVTFPTSWSGVHVDEDSGDVRDPWGIPFGVDTADWLDVRGACREAHLG